MGKHAQWETLPEFERQRPLQMHGGPPLCRAWIVAAGACCLFWWLADVPLKADPPLTVAVANPIISSATGVQEVWVSEELSPDAVKDIPLSAAGLLSRSYVRSHLTAAEEQAVHNKNQGQIQRENPSIHAKSRHYARLWFEAWRHANRVPATVRQEQAIKKADKTLKRFFASLGLPYKPLDVTFIPNNLFPGSLAGGCDSLYSETIFLPAEDSHDLMDVALIHEGIHFNSRGSWPLRLEEGIVETLTEDLIFVNGSVYAPEREAVDCIVGLLRKRGHVTTSAAEKMLATAFLTDDASKVENILGNLTWQRIVCLADGFAGYQSDTALWKEYVKGVKNIREPVVAVIPNPRAEDSVLAAYASVRPAREAR